MYFHYHRLKARDAKIDNLNALLKESREENQRLEQRIKELEAKNLEIAELKNVKREKSAQITQLEKEIEKLKKKYLKSKPTRESP